RRFYETDAERVRREPLEQAAQRTRYRVTLPLMSGGDGRRRTRPAGRCGGGNRSGKEATGSQNDSLSWAVVAFAEGALRPLLVAAVRRRSLLERRSGHVLPACGLLGRQQGQDLLQCLALAFGAEPVVLALRLGLARVRVGDDCANALLLGVG